MVLLQLQKGGEGEKGDATEREEREGRKEKKTHPTLVMTKTSPNEDEEVKDPCHRESYVLNRENNRQDQQPNATPNTGRSVLPNTSSGLHPP